MILLCMRTNLACISEYSLHQNFVVVFVLYMTDFPQLKKCILKPVSVIIRRELTMKAISQIAPLGECLFSPLSFLRPLP